MAITIDGLPPEILDDIVRTFGGPMLYERLDVVYRAYRYNLERRRSRYLLLSQVSRTFRTIALPYVYESIILSDGIWSRGRGNWHTLDWLMQANADLAEYVKELKLEFLGNSQTALFPSTFTGLKSLTLYGQINAYLKQIPVEFSLPNLEAFSALNRVGLERKVRNATGEYLTIEPFLPILEQPRLKCFHLQRVELKRPSSSLKTANKMIQQIVLERCSLGDKALQGLLSVRTPKELQLKSNRFESMMRALTEIPKPVERLLFFPTTGWDLPMGFNLGMLQDVKFLSTLRQDTLDYRDRETSDPMLCVDHARNGDRVNSLDDIFSGLPPHLIHLRITSEVPYYDQPLLRFLTEKFMCVYRQCPGLRVLEYLLYDFGDPKNLDQTRDAATALSQTAASNGISLIIRTAGTRAP